MKAIDQLKERAAKIGVTLDVTDYAIHPKQSLGRITNNPHRSNQAAERKKN